MPADHPGQLLDQVGVAAGPVEDDVHGVRRRVAAEDGRELGGDLTAVEPAQLDPLDRPVPLPAGEQRPQRMPPVQLVGPVGGHQQHPGLTQRPGQERDQVQRGLIGPVQVLDQEQHRLGRAQPVKQAEHHLQQLRLLHVLAVRRRAGAGAQVGQQPGQPGPGRAEQLGPGFRGRATGQRAQRVHQRGQRQAFRAEFDALAGEHPEPGPGGPRRQFAHQAGLAHPGFPADQRDGGLPGAHPVQQRGECGHLLASADENRAHHADRHGQNGATYPPRPRRRRPRPPSSCCYQTFGGGRSLVRAGRRAR